MKRDDLRETIKDIGTPFGLKPEFDMRAEPEAPKIKAEPNNWDEVKDDPKAYGENFDYRMMDVESGVPIFMPCCVAAQEWLRSQVGETQHWFSDLDGFFGVQVDNGHGFYRGIFLKAASDAGLISEEEYERNMLNEQQSQQGVEE